MNRVLALLRSLQRPRELPAVTSGWERTWQAMRELNDDLDPPPSWDPCIVTNPRTPQRGELL